MKKPPAHPLPDIAPPEARDAQRQIRELQVRQSEMERQNEELRATTLGASAAMSADLKESDEQLRAMTEAHRRSAEEKEAILNALPAQIALLDPLGCIVAVNERWGAFAAANGAQSSDCFIGRNYLEVCDGAAGDCSEEASAVSQGLRAVLTGRQPGFTLEYPCHSPQEQRWYCVMAAPISNARQAGAVVMHLDITERRQAEAELQRASEEMRALARRLVAIRDEQVAHIARELHDELGQTLIVLTLHVRAMQKRLELLETRTGEPPSPEAREAVGLIEASFSSPRRL